MERLNNPSMSAYTSFRTGGMAKELVVVHSEDELKEVLREATASGRKFTILGAGTNTLFACDFYDGLVIKNDIEGVKFVENDGEAIVTVGAGVSVIAFAREALKRSLTGFEFASGIPGSFGGGIFMNAGAYDGEFKDIVKSVTAVSNDGSDTVTIDAEDLEFGYRSSTFNGGKYDGFVVSSATIVLKKGNRDAIKARMDELTKRRREKQPLEYPSCGSTFKRPEGNFAGTLIESCGLKGTSIGGAEVSEKHAGFIINKGGATYDDILRLIKLVQNTVSEQTGIELEPEIKIIK